MIQFTKGAVAGLAHIGVFVSNIEVSTAFYLDTLGFECCERAENDKQEGTIRYAFIKKESCTIELIEKPNSAQKTDGPVNHIAFSVDDIDSAMAHLKAKGVKFETQKPVLVPMLQNGIRFAMFRGPDGERLEIMQQL